MPPTRCVSNDVAEAVVDASVWVSRFLAGEANHAATVRWFTVHADLAVSPAIVLSEVASALARRTGHVTGSRAAVRAMLRLHGLRLVAIDHALAIESADLAARLRLRGADAAYVAVARRLGRHLITWDREQLARSAPAVHASTPG